MVKPRRQLRILSAAVVVATVLPPAALLATTHSFARAGIALAAGVVLALAACGLAQGLGAWRAPQRRAEDAPLAEWAAMLAGPLATTLSSWMVIWLF